MSLSLYTAMRLEGELSMSERLMAQLDGARLVQYDPDGYLLAWYGGESTGVHVYTADGTKIGYWQLDASVPVTPERVAESMSEHRLSGEPYPA